MTAIEIALIALAATALALLAVPIIVGCLNNDKDKRADSREILRLLIKPFVALIKRLLGPFQL